MPESFWLQGTMCGFPGSHFGDHPDASFVAHPGIVHGYSSGLKGISMRKSRFRMHVGALVLLVVRTA